MAATMASTCPVASASAARSALSRPLPPVGGGEVPDPGEQAAQRLAAVP